MESFRREPKSIHDVAPHFLAVGRLCYDLWGPETHLGGSCAYSAILARNLGYSSAIVTSVGKDFSCDALPPEIGLAMQVEGETSTFVNRPTPQGRVQHVRSISPPIRMSSIPEAWLESTIIFLCPILDDFTPGIIDSLRSPLVGVAPQGWMRYIGHDRRAYKMRFEALERVAPKANIVLLSEEDVCVEDLPKLVRLSPALVLTRGRSGAELYWDGGQYHEHIPAFVREEVDETGAGDVFGAAFLLKYHETQDLHESAFFASWVASFVVQGVGIEAIPSEDQVMLAEESAVESGQSLKSSHFVD